jgi:hypothetical protein
MIIHIDASQKMEPAFAGRQAQTCMRQAGFHDWLWFPPKVNHILRVFM